jgi:Flp pilus assembly protein TadG
MFMVTRKLRRWRDRGAAAVEFALIVPALILLIFGSIEFGLAVQARTVVGNAAREGVRVLSLSNSVSDSKQAVTTALGGISGAATATVVVSCKTPAGATCTAGGTDAQGNVGTVVVTLTYTGVTGMFPQLTNATLTASSYMRIE